MIHKDYENGFINHNIEARLGVPCGSVSVVADESYPVGYYALVELDGRGNGQTEVEVLPADTVYGGGAAQ